MGYISTVALLLPVVLIIYLKLYKNRSLLTLMIYYSTAFIYNLMTEKIINLPLAYVKAFGTITNLLDVPLSLIYLLYFVKSNSLRKKIHAATLAFIAFEILVTVMFGLGFNAVSIIMGPGILLVLSLSVLFFIEEIKVVVQQGKAAGKALMSASTLFAYGCFLIIYLFYYVLKTPYVKDAFLVYFFITTFASVLMCAGLIMEKKRFKILEEIKTTRKELSMLYPNEKMSFSKETAGSLQDDDQY